MEYFVVEIDGRIAGKTQDYANRIRSERHMVSTTTKPGGGMEKGISFNMMIVTSCGVVNARLTSSLNHNIRGGYAFGHRP